MRRERQSTVLPSLRVLFGVGTLAGLSDGELLERFAHRRDEIAEAAFAVLVERHGPAVLRLCRGVLRNPHDAEDAFQATFLVLARRAESIRRKDAVGAWLRSVALRVARTARADAARRQAREHEAARDARISVEHQEPADWVPVLLEELGRLPEKFQVPLVLCDLEQLTQEEAARRLGWPLGTVRSRVLRGRQRLRARLVRRGLVPTLVAWAAWPTRDASAALPSGLAEATARAALHRAVGGVVSLSVITLTEETLRAMSFTTLRTFALPALAAGCLLTAAAVFAQQGTGPPGAAGVSPTARPPGQPALNAVDPPPPETRFPYPSLPADAMRQRIKQLEIELERLRNALASADARGLARSATAPAPSAAGVPRIDVPPQTPVPLDHEERLREIERKLDQLLAAQTTSRRDLAFPILPPLAEDRAKHEAWARLIRDGYIGRLESTTVNWVQFLTQLYGRYLNRRPSAEELSLLKSFCGPGWEQATSAPESLVRGLLGSEEFFKSPLGRVLLGSHATAATPGVPVE